MTSLLITGGTGSFGRAFTRCALDAGADRVVILSRDELKQSQMRHDFGDDPRLRFFIGDVRDVDRLRRACEGVNVIVHAAAMKRVDACENDPIEAIKTNVLGAQNVVTAALDSGVRKVVALSTDKAAAPINLYGATKLCSDKLFLAANGIRGGRDLGLSVVRYGNVLGSRGSVVPFFLEHRKRGWLPITDPEMTRFSITMPEAVRLVNGALAADFAGLFVPKIPSYKLTDVATAIAPEAEQRIIGIRPGEKLHEDLITVSDGPVYDFGWYRVITSEPVAIQPMDPGFVYRSNTNDKWLGVDQIRKLIREHVDPGFGVGK